MTKKDFIEKYDTLPSKMDKIKLIFNLESKLANRPNNGFGLKDKYELVSENKNGEEVYSKLPKWFKYKMRLKSVQ